MPASPLECPGCKTPMTVGIAEIRGNALGFLLIGFSWQELFFKSADAPEVSVLAPNMPHPAYRCPSCGMVVIGPEAITQPDHSGASECLSCGAALVSGETTCAHCGWTYTT